MPKSIVVVGAVIRNEHNEILCALRSPTMSLANHWEFPGGKVEQGELFEEALRREIEEELGCVIEVQDKITEATYTYEAIQVNLHTYWAVITSGQPKPREHAELRWVPVGELLTLRWAPADIPTLEVIKQVLPKR